MGRHRHGEADKVTAEDQGMEQSVRKGYSNTKKLRDKMERQRRDVGSKQCKVVKCRKSKRPRKRKR